MNDPLRQAAERLLRENLHMSGGWNRDTCMVAEAYLAEHPSDDEQPINKAWLMSIGFTFDHKWSNGFSYCQLRAGQNTITVSQPSGDDWSEEEWLVGGERIPHGLMPFSRSDVRHLLSRLGIKLQEQSNE